MRTLLPILSILLALVASGCIAYVAWELTSDKYHRPDDKGPDGGAGQASGSDRTPSGPSSD